MNKTVVFGPFVGEFGWEVFAWQPLVRNVVLTENHKRIYVYGSPGKSLLYQFATEYREIEIPDHEAECMLWRDPKNYQDELNKIGAAVFEPAKQEFGDCQLFWYNNIRVFNDPMYMNGKPELIRPESSFVLERDSRPTIAFCVRHRQMSDFRNWAFENWTKLAELLKNDCLIFVLGKVGEEDRYGEKWKMPEDVRDKTNQTTVNDCINILANVDLAVGGSTGTLHLASRCGTNHLVWGGERNIFRYAETNWFGAKHKVYNEWGWVPEPEQVAGAIRHFFDKGDFE